MAKNPFKLKVHFLFQYHCSKSIRKLVLLYNHQFQINKSNGKTTNKLVGFEVFEQLELEVVEL